MLRARSPTTGKRSWVARTRRSSRLAGPRRDAVGRRGLRDPALEQRGRDLDVGGGALLGEEHPEDRLLQLGAALAVLDAVVGEHGGEPVAELLREPAPLGVQALQVGVEVLLGAVHPQLGVQVLAGRAVAAQLGEVGHHAEQPHVVGDDADAFVASSARAAR